MRSLRTPTHYGRFSFWLTLLVRFRPQLGEVNRQRSAELETLRRGDLTRQQASNALVAVLV